jgi:spermidine synthase
MRILAGDDETKVSLKDLVARVLAFDYLGSLAASILFPLALLPFLGMVRTSLLFGLFNAAIALWAVHAFRPRIRAFGLVRVQSLVTAALLLGGFVMARDLEDFGESELYDFPVIWRSRPRRGATTCTWSCSAAVTGSRCASCCATTRWAGSISSISIRR